MFLKNLNRVTTHRRTKFYAQSIPFLLFLWRRCQTWAMASSFARFLYHTQRRITVCRPPLDEWSALRRDLYLTTHSTHNRQTSINPDRIRTRNPSKRAAVDPRLRWGNHRYRPVDTISTTNNIFKRRSAWHFLLLQDTRWQRRQVAGYNFICTPQTKPLACGKNKRGRRRQRRKCDVITKRELSLLL